MNSAEKPAFLEAVAKRIQEKCTFIKSSVYFGEEKERRLLLPSGDEWYLSFWVRDCTMMCEGGLATDEDMKLWLGIFAAHGQNGAEELKLEHGLRVPPYALADHINYNAKPVWFPGTYSDTEDQGEGKCGFFPPYGDNYYFITMAYTYIKHSGDMEVLDEVFSGLKLRDRLLFALRGYGIDEKTGCCFGDKEHFTVDWGFNDSIRKDGLLLMPSLLRMKAARELAELLSGEAAAEARAIYEKLYASIPQVFFDEESGWLWSATGMGHSRDVWASTYAVAERLLPEAIASAVSNAALKDYRAGMIARDGAVRSVPIWDDFSEKSAWEYSWDSNGNYQNGAYWPTATGWLYLTLRLTDEAAAEQFIDEFIEDTKKHADEGAPYEFTAMDYVRHGGNYYGTSAVLPYYAYKLSH